MRRWFATLAMLLAIESPVLAQSGPSVEQIIRSLTPTGDVTRAATRGIRLGPTVDSQTKETAATRSSSTIRANTRGPGTERAAATIALTVNFATGSADLTPQAEAMLDRLGAALASDALAAYRFRIEGHTDTVGTHDYNQGLSERRAEAVVAYIRNKYGVDPGRMEAVGLGASQPLVVTADQTDEPRNRRVQVWNIGG